jgi:OmpA-OmpF porin, OOP family
MQLKPIHALFLAALIAPAQVQDLPGTSDHPLISRLAGSHLVTFDEQEFDRYSLLTGKYDTKLRQNPTLDVEGRVTRRTYIAPENITLLTAFRNFEQAVRASNLKVLFSCLAPQCDAGARTANALVQNNPPRLFAHYINIRSIVEFGYIAAEGTWQGRPVWLAAGIGVKPAAGIRYTVDGRVAPRLPTHRVVFSIDVVEKEQMATGLVTVDHLSSSMSSSGRAVLEGLYFDTNKTELKPESDAALQTIAVYLKQNGSTRFFVTGHTDVTGDYTANLKLAQGRAQSVVNALVSTHGVPAAQLTPVGVGPVAPAASNAAETGRALNRRVELVQASVVP